MTLTEALERFLTAKADRSPRTLDWYREQVRSFFAWLEESGWNNRQWLESSTIDRYLADQRRGHSPNTVHARYRALHAFFAWLVKRELLPAEMNPMAKVDPPERPRNPKKRRVEQAEYEQLYASITGDTWVASRDRALLLILFWSGLRVSEAVALTIQDINMERNEIYVTKGKGDKSRIAPCTPELRAVLLEYLMSRPMWHGPELWLNSDGANGLRQSNPILHAEGVRQMLIRRCRRANVEYRNPHAFRHGFAVEMLNAGADISAISAMMGHSSVKVTEAEYAFWLDHGIRREYEEAYRKMKKSGTSRTDVSR